jgi:hypothetical protein
VVDESAHVRAVAGEKSAKALEKAFGILTVGDREDVQCVDGLAFTAERVEGVPRPAAQRRSVEDLKHATSADRFGTAIRPSVAADGGESPTAAPTPGVSVGG